MRPYMPLAVALAFISLFACSHAQTPPLSVTGRQEAVRAAMENALDPMIDAAIAAAKPASDRAAAERLARQTFTRLAAERSYAPQFQVQTQVVATGSLQIQLQAQLASEGQSVQAQRQLVLKPFPLKR